MGEGDHTWIETYAVDRDVYDKIQELETGKKAKPNPISTVLDDVAFIDEWDETLGNGLDDEDDGWEDVDELLKEEDYTEDED